MVPKNLMETAVQGRINSHRQQPADTEGACWCALCLADMQALALSSLPPRYVTRREEVVADHADFETSVRFQVARAVRHVGNNPKHRAMTASAAAPGAAVAVVNVTFEVGFALIEERIRRHADSCDCWDCRCDAVAFALNRFPPQYGVAVDGRSGFPEESRRQMADEMATFLDLGVRIAATVPRHDDRR